MADKISTLLKGAKMQEQEAAQECLRIGTVADNRQRIVSELRGRERQKSAELLQEIPRRRWQAVREGNLQQVSAVTAYQRRLEKELERVSAELREREQDLAAAALRLAAAEAELIEARRDKRKVEKVISNRDAARQVAAAARDEAENDELSQVLWRRGK